VSNINRPDLPGPNVIAIILDFDDTLGEDTTNLFLREKLGMKKPEIEKFWNNEVALLVEKGWDPPLAYIDLILQRLRAKKLTVTNQDLRHMGKRVKLFPGVPDLFDRLHKFVANKSEFQEAHIGIEFYVISGGFEEIIRGTSIAGEMQEIFGCTFVERNGTLQPKSVVSFTEKTKFLYAINKGISGRELRRNPYSVNDVIAKEKRRIPFTNMIYLGDGPTDIPCFSAVQQYQGKTIGVLKYVKKLINDREVLVDTNRAWAIAKGDRATLGPFQPNYRKASDLYINLTMQIEHVGLGIYDAFKRRE
jgi:phosphoserine phosphatase